MSAEKVTVMHVAEEEEVTLSSSSIVNALERDREEEEREVKEDLSNGANGNTVTEETDGDGDTDGSYVFINGNDALNGESEEVDLEKNGNGIVEEDQAVENLEIKGEVKSESGSIKDVEGDDGSCIGIMGKDKESIELCHVEGPVVEEKPWDLVGSEHVYTINAVEHGVSETSGANQNGVTSEASGSANDLSKYSEAVNVLDSTFEKHTDVNSDGGNLEYADKTSAIISNGDSTNDTEEHTEMTVDSNCLVELPVISNVVSTNDSLKKEEHAEMAVDDEKHAEMAVDDEKHAEMAAVDDGGSNDLVELSERVSEINGDDDIVKVSKAVVDLNYSIQQNSVELSSGVSDINGDKDNVKITVSEAAVDPESAFEVDNISNEVCSVSIPASNEFHQDSEIVVVDEDIRSKKNDDSEIILNDDGCSATRIENEFVKTDENSRRLDEEVVEIENHEAFVQEELVKNSEPLVGKVENPETLVREEVVKNSESLVEEYVAENSEAPVEKEVANIENPKSVIDQDVEVDVTDIGNSKGILEKEVEVADIGNYEGILKKEVEAADPENLELAEAAADIENLELAEAAADIENLEAADIENSEPVTAIADIGNLSREETVENPETDVVADIVNPEEASATDNDSGVCSIQFGSIGKPVDEVVVSKSPFNLLIRVPRCDDESLKEKIRLAQIRVDEKTRSRDAIRIEMQAKRATCKDYGDNFEAVKSQERAARDLLKSKRQEIDSIQSVINIEDIDGRIRNMEHMIQHETMLLKEEKQIIREIKQLKQVREQLSSSMGRNDEVQQGSDQKELIEKRMKSLKKEADQLRVELLKAEAVTKAAKKRYNDETEKLNTLLSQFKAADDIRQEAYAELQSLKKQSYEKNKYYWQYRDDAKKANDLSLKGDKEALQNLCLNQVERFMDLWNNSDEFRKEYVRCNLRSTLRRLRTLDGRALGPDEQPPVIPQAVNETVRKEHIVYETQIQEKVVPLNVVKFQLEERTQVKAVLAKVVKSVAAPATASTATPFKDEVEEVTEEKPKKSEEEEELARKAEKLRKEEEAIKLREQRRLEEIVKAKEAQERKKRMAEKAQARAAQRAQKETEQKEKEREKRERKKERRKLAATEVLASDVSLTPTDSTSETQPAEIAKESENKEKPVTVAKRTQKPSQFTKAKSIPPPLRNRVKRRMQPWMWVLLTTLIIFTLFLIGNSNFFNLGMQRFNF